MSYAISLDDIREARERIAPYVIRTPLIRLKQLDSTLGCQVYVKAECMQETGAFKFRGAMNTMLSLNKEELKAGVVAASSGNHGRAIAYAAKMLGSKATIVVPRTASPVKVEAIRQLGAEIILCDAPERHKVAAQVAEERKSILVHPFNDPRVMAGQGTMGLEIMEQCPDLTTVVSPLSGGGLLSGVVTAVKGVAQNVKVYGAEPAVLPRYSKSIEANDRVTVPACATLADALITQTPGDKTFPIIRDKVDKVVDVAEEFIPKAMKLLLMEGKVLAEPSSCIGIAAVMQNLISVKPEDKVCFILSGGNIGFEQVRKLMEAAE